MGLRSVYFFNSKRMKDSFKKPHMYKLTVSVIKM